MVAIIKPYREIELINQTKFAGHVHIKKVDRSGRVTFETKFKNLLTDYFIQNGFGELGVHTAILLGSGVQTEPQPSDTALNNFLSGSPASQVGGSTNVVLGATPADDYNPFTWRTTFNYGQANGALTEIGLGASTAVGAYASYTPTDPNHRLLAKSLIKDSNGNPVVVNKTDAEQLIVSYEIRTYRSNEAESTFNIGGTDVTAKILSYSRTIGAATDIDIDQEGRGVSAQDILGQTTSATSLGNLMINGVSPSNGYVRINPTTISRDISSFGNFRNAFTGNRSPSNPYIISGGVDIRTQTGTQMPNFRDYIVFISPTTRARTALTLPANYRMDMSFSFERGRK